MTAPVKTVCLINGSLRGRKASSLSFLQDVSRRLPDALYRKTVITVRGNAKQVYSAETLAGMAQADVLVFVFPLYNYALPGALMALLEEFHRFVLEGNALSHDVKVYAVVNCAFPRPELTTGEAVRVMRNFCRRLSLNWRFAICIGTGPVVVVTKKVPFLDRTLKKAPSAISMDVGAGAERTVSDCFVHPVIPERVIRRIREQYEKKGEMMVRRDRPRALQ